jgi:hypothetical protein
MRCLAKLLVFLAACMAAAVSRAADGNAAVSMELVTVRGLPVTASQDWYKILSGLGVGSLRIRSGAGEKPEVTTEGTKTSPRYRVVGVLSKDNVLYLPGGTFKVSDTAGLRRWLATLGEHGSEAVTEPAGAFGLVPRQLEGVAAELRRPVTATTKGRPAEKVFDAIAGTLTSEVDIDTAARRALAAVTIQDELSGLSAGTALAIVLRPAGLVLLPERAGRGEVRYRVTSAGASAGWPIGWKSQAKPNVVLPDLFTYLNVEIKDISVAEALEAIEGRLKTPFLFDRNALAVHGIDPAQTMADVPGKRMTYSQTLHRVMAQAKLKYELRVDEAEKPFLWITTVKAVEN